MMFCVSVMGVMWLLCSECGCGVLCGDVSCLTVAGVNECLVCY